MSERQQRRTRSASGRCRMRWVLYSWNANMGAKTNVIKSFDLILFKCLRDEQKMWICRNQIETPLKYLASFVSLVAWSWIENVMHTWCARAEPLCPCVCLCAKAKRAKANERFVCFIGCWLWQRSKRRRATYMNVLFGFWNVCSENKIRKQMGFFPCAFFSRNQHSHSFEWSHSCMAFHSFSRYSHTPASVCLLFGLFGLLLDFECQYM